LVVLWLAVAAAAQSAQFDLDDWMSDPAKFQSFGDTATSVDPL